MTFRWQQCFKVLIPSLSDNLPFYVSRWVLSNNLFPAGGSVIKPENPNSFELTYTNHNHSGHDSTRAHCWQTGRSQSPSPFSTAHSQKHLSDSPLANSLTSKAETTFSCSPPTEINKKGGGKENSNGGRKSTPFSRQESRVVELQPLLSFSLKRTPKKGTKA